MYSSHTSNTWYRYEDTRTTNGIHVYLREFNVVRYTPQGAWIEQYGHGRFVLRNSRKRYACPSKEEALESFRARKKRQIKILTSQLERAKLALIYSGEGSDSTLYSMVE
jgi:hypothetical protein